MTGPPFSVEALIERVQEGGDGNRDELDLLARALSLGHDVQLIGDALVEHFVGQARGSGKSWTAIGDRLGVSKQAARKRFGHHEDMARPAVAGSFQPRLVACLHQAGEEARLDGSREIGTHHQLLGLLVDGVGAAVLETLGVNATTLRQASGRLFGQVGPAAPLAPPESAEARCAVRAAADLSRQGGHDYVGTEHLLFVLAADPGSRSRRLLNDLGVSFADVKRELASFVQPCRTGRRRRRRAAATCSFCGKGATRDLQLIAGEGVWICHECVRLADEVMSSREPIG